MPHLSLKNGQIILDLTDTKEIAEDADTKLFITSILGMDNLTGSKYIYKESQDFVGNAQLLNKVTKYFSEVGAPCDIDAGCAVIIDRIANSDTQLSMSRVSGLEIKSSMQADLEIPGFVRQLKPYQVMPVKHAASGFYTANFSVPGSGKTTITYAAFALLRSKSIVDKIMVIGPRSSFMPWEEEYEACFDKKPDVFRVVAGSQNFIKEAVGGHELFLLTYQMASNPAVNRILIDVLASNNFMLVLDESHHVKNFSGGHWATSVLKLAPYAKRRLILTGTPMPNSLKDLWTQFTFLWPFKNLLGEPFTYKEIATNANGLETVRNMLQPFYTRITKDQLELPPINFNVKTIPLNKVQRVIYEAMVAKTLTELVACPTDRMRLREWRQNKVIRLLQTASNPSLLTEYSVEFKIPPLSAGGLSVVSLIENYSKFEIPSKIVEANKLARQLLTNGDKVIIWTTFIHNIKTLNELLADTQPLMIFGEIPKDDNENVLINREQIIKKFRDSKTPCALIANPNCLAESVSLHRVCRNAIYIDRTFNAGQYIQSLDRIHRIGLKPDEIVTYHLLQSKDTIDEVINLRLNEKYQHMLDMLNDDFTIADLDAEETEISDSEFNKDFQAVYEQLIKQKNGE